ncbi:MAG: nickel pincer cofactor biosynthesis protein LarC [Methanoregula sp.]|jgi:uncharacterized protein (TIGR00299 family) protein
MRVLVFDPFHGASGDMITAALLDCGADRERVAAAMRAVVAEPTVETVTRAGIQAVKVHTRATPAHRSLDDVYKRLDDAAPHVPPEALATARRVFSRINAAEEEVHGAHVHFHEVGADDAIADVVGACTALAMLKIDGVVVLPLALGSGTATGSHGIIPIPAPATVAILKGSGLVTMKGNDDGELCTPTGAALLAEFSSIGAADLGGYTIQAVGYGAGSRDTPHSPNVLRAMAIETTGALPQDTVDLLETNVDDVSGEVIGEALARFMAAGARDASAMPVIMKKGRPGYLVTVIALPETSAGLARLMARELGTLGVRRIPVVHRFVAERTMADVEVEIDGNKKNLPVKCGWMDGRIYTLKAEFDTARDWAAELDLPVRDVLRAVEAAAWNQVRNHQKSTGPGDR